MLIVKILGWLAAVGSVWAVADPRSLFKIKDKVWSGRESVLRLIGALSIAWGIWLCWIAICFA